ncbi:hypothetical protein AYK26_01620 [Euryarchaeota archaeon SM23-78]|nr:MAG: hypothetical protein AYK26_01620 [Euryarchaeota archaeon SM23-78]MBW3000477.1 hypothetical protein [Candidatus Woesearchaeota archaeon]
MKIVDIIKKTNNLEKIIFTISTITFLGLGFLPISLKVKNQEPVMKMLLGNGYLYACYDFQKDGYLDRIDAHFKIADQTIWYHVFEIKKETKTFEYMQKEYDNKMQIRKK